MAKKLNPIGDNKALRWPDPLPDLGGKTCIVTGANAGTGYETALWFAGRGARVVLACRSAERAQQALERVHQVHPDSKAEVWSLDLASLASVREFASKWTDERHGQIDFLINNAGMGGADNVKTEDGFGLTYQSNFLGHFLLTTLLLPSLRQAAAPRIVWLSSEAGYSKGYDVKPDNFNSEDFPQTWRFPTKYWWGYRAYARMKMLCLLAAVEMQRRIDLRRELSHLSVAAVHPGMVRSSFFSTAGVFTPLFQIGIRLLGRSAEQGAMTIIWAATAEVRGQMTGDCHIVDLPPLASDEKLRADLWEVAVRDAGLPGDGLRF